VDLERAKEEFNAKAPESPASLRSAEGGWMVGLSGAFDLASSAALLDFLIQAVEATPAGGALVLDLTRVSYLPSTGVGALSTALVKSKQRGIAFSVRNVAEPVAKIIKILGIWDYLHVE
jgi:anti-anti-sigma factor